MKKIVLGWGILLLMIMPSIFYGECNTPSQSNPRYQWNFNGLRIGGNLGVVSHKSHRNDLDGFFIENAGWTTIDTGAVAGGQLGYDWQCGYKLFGIIADWNWTNAESRVRLQPNDLEIRRSINDEFNWFTTLRARSGLVIRDVLFYVTAGAAAAKFKTILRFDRDKLRFSNARWGWTGGAGAEFLFARNWSFGAEVLFLHFDNYNERLTSTEAEVFSFTYSNSAWAGRILFNYRFGNLFSL